MATRAATTTVLDRDSNKAAGCVLVEWSGLTFASTDDGDPIELGAYADRSVQVTGTFGTGGSLSIEGSNDGTNYAVLTDPQGNALDVTSAKIEAISELVRYIRPRITAGDGTTSLACTMMLRRA